MSLRIRENLNGYNDEARDYVREMTEKTGEYIDQFTVVPDLRTTDEILSRQPKCCIGHVSDWPTDEELKEKYKLKPATKRDTSRDRQIPRRDE